MNKHILRTGVLIVLSILSSPLQAQQAPLELTLQESIEIAKENSPLARAARYALEAARWRYKSFRADLLPSLELAGDVPNFNLRNTAVLTDSGRVIFEERQSDASLGLSIEQNIPQTGGRLSIDSDLTRFGIFENEDTYNWISRPVSINYIQPLFQFNSLKWQRRIEPLRHRISKKEFVEDMEDIAFTVTQNFFNLLLAKINVEVAEFNVTVNDSIYNISQGRFQVGSIAENDLLQSELAYRNAESDLTTAQLNYIRIEEQFKALLGIPISQPIEIISPDEAPDISVDVDKALDLAIENNSTALQFMLSEIQANQAYDQARKEAGFSANLIARYGLNRTSTEFDELYQDPQTAQAFTVGFQIPLFNWGKNLAEIRAAQNQQQETANTIAYQRLQFELDVKSTVREFTLLKDQMELAAISDDIAERRYEVSKNRYLIGKIDVTNLFIAQNEKDSARRSYIQALRNYWTGYYNLRRLTLYDFQQDEPIFYEIQY